MGEADKRIENISKTSKTILYSTKVFGEKENEIHPEIMMKDIKREDDNDKVGTFLILKYTTLKGIPLQVIIASLDKIYDRKTRVEKINEFIKNQLRDNANEVRGYKYYEELRDYLRTERISLNFTPEGIDILSTKSKEEEKFNRTICENSNGKVKQLYGDLQLQEMRERNVPEIVKHTRWLEARQVILKDFETEKERQDFLKGEKISQIIQSTEIEDENIDKALDNKMKKRKQIVVNYLLDIYEGKNVSVQSDEKKNEYQQKEDKLKLLKEQLENYNSNSENQQIANKIALVDMSLEAIKQEKSDYEETLRIENEEEQALLRKYLGIKEKGLAIDINIFLEKLEAIFNSRIQKQIDQQKEQNEVSPNDYREIKILQNYQHFFSFVKSGADRTARIFAMATEKIDFEILTRLMTKFNGQDQEILQYLDVKQKMLEEIKTEEIKNKERYYPSVRELYKFLLNSDVRKVTKKDDEEMFVTIFDKAKEKLLENNAKEIRLYNSYAKRFGAYVCPVQENENKSEDEKIKTGINSTSYKNNSLEEKKKIAQDSKTTKVFQYVDDLLEDINRKSLSNKSIRNPGDNSEGR